MFADQIRPISSMTPPRPCPLSRAEFRAETAVSQGESHTARWPAGLWNTRVMPTARGGHASTESAAPPAVVYDLIADVTRMGEWSPECYRCEWLDGATAAAPGVRFRGYNRLGRLRWERTAVINTAIRGREFGFATISDIAGREETRWRYTMDPSPSGTLLTESFEFLWCSVANRLAEALIPRGRQVNRGVEETLRRIKRAAETESSRRP